MMLGTLPLQRFGLARTKAVLQTIACLVALVFIPGCGGDDANQSGIIQRETMWSTVDADHVPGLDQAAVTRVTMERDERFFLIWSDLGFTIEMENHGIDDQHLYRGAHKNQSGKSLSFSIQKDAPNALQIGGQKLDLKKGSLILVQTWNSELKTLQLTIDDLDAIPGSRQGLIEYAKSRSEISKFFDPKGQFAGPAVATGL